MGREKTYFGIGLVIGIVLAALFLFYFAPRYTTVKAGDTLIKQDRWSGQSWRFVDNQWKRIVGENRDWDKIWSGQSWRFVDNGWKRIVGENRDWDKIDKALTGALGIATDTPSRTNALDLLRKKDPILKDLSDDELLERIKLVYSK
jgi:hypothetical protein